MNDGSMALQQIVDRLTIERIIDIVKEQSELIVYWPAKALQCLVAHVLAILSGRRILVDQDTAYESGRYAASPTNGQWARLPRHIQDLVAEFDKEFAGRLCDKQDALRFLRKFKQREGR